MCGLFAFPDGDSKSPYDIFFGYGNVSSATYNGYYNESFNGTHVMQFYDYPTSNDPNFGPNGAWVIAEAVPEPATLIIWSLLGGLGIAVAHLRRRKAA
jgi:hypothetical protein